MFQSMMACPIFYKNVLLWPIRKAQKKSVWPMWPTVADYRPRLKTNQRKASRSIVADVANILYINNKKRKEKTAHDTRTHVYIKYLIYTHI
jgi:hypothetical protein